MVIISFLLQIDERSPSPAMNIAKKKRQEQNEHCENRIRVKFEFISTIF